MRMLDLVLSNSMFVEGFSTFSEGEPLGVFADKLQDELCPSLPKQNMLGGLVASTANPHSLFDQGNLATSGCDQVSSQELSNNSDKKWDLGNY